MGNFKPRPQRAVERELRNSPAMAKHLANVANEAATQVQLRTDRWVKDAGEQNVRSGARIGADGNVEGYVAVASPFWHIPEFGTATAPATAPIRRGVRAALQARGGNMKEQSR